MEIVTRDRELSNDEASAALSRAFDAVVRGKVEAPTVDSLKATQQIGWCFSALQRLCWSDLWAAWDQVHGALGVPMDWRGASTMQNVELPRVWGFLLRSMDTPDFIAALAECDRHMRRARRTAFRELDHQHDTLVKLIDLHRHDQSTSGLLDQAGRVAQLAEVRERLQAERAVLIALVKDYYIVIEGRQVRVSFDHADDTGTEVQVDALCPECGDDTDWSFDAAKPLDPINVIVCRSCDKQWKLEYGEVR